jgi:hypothetical protein
MDFTALNITGGWIALGIVLLYILAELSVVIITLASPVRRFIAESNEKRNDRKHLVRLQLKNILKVGVVAVPALGFFLWYYLLHGHDVLFRFVTRITADIYLQHYLELCIFIAVFVLIFLIAGLVDFSANKDWKQEGFLSFIKNEKNGISIMVFMVVVILVVLWFVSWMMWRFPLTANGIIAFLIFYRLFKKTHWYQQRPFKGGRKKDSLGAQEERHKQVSAWLSRVGSGVTEVHFQKGNFTKAFVRGSDGNKVMVIRFSQLASPASEELIMHCARAIAYSRSAANTGRSIALLCCGLAGGLFFYWEMITKAITLPFAFREPDFVPACILALLLVFVITRYVPIWFTFPAFKKRHAEADDYVLQYTDEVVQFQLKKHLEGQLKFADLANLPVLQYSVWPDRFAVRLKRLKTLEKRLHTDPL